MSIQPTPEEFAAAPRVWKRVGPEQNVRVIDLEWIKQRRLTILERQQGQEVLRQEEKIDPCTREKMRQARLEMSIRLQQQKAKALGPGARMNRILLRISRATKVPVGDIRGASRTQHIVLARQAVCYWCSRRTKMAISDIGRFMGIDHTTVLNANQRYPEKRARQGRYLRPITRGKGE